jgi:hypothetical protein
MQHLTSELTQQLSSKLKLGERAKPVCRVEVDRMAFIPGRTQELKWLDATQQGNIQAINSVINITQDSSGNDIYEGSTTNNSLNIVFPAEGYSLANVSSEYGQRWGKLHGGIDIAVPLNTNVLSAWDGKVVVVDRSHPSMGGGNEVWVQHSGGIMTKYFHNNSLVATVGDNVNAGGVIAKAGSTGDSTGNHLHFEVWEGSTNGYGGTRVNPRPYLEGKKKIGMPSVNVGAGVVDSGTVSGTPGEVLLDERFVTREWKSKSRYTADLSFAKLSDTTQGAVTLSLDASIQGSSPVTTGFSIALTSTRNCYMDIGYKTLFDVGSVNELWVYVNNKVARRVTSFANSNSNESVLNTYIPSGDVTVRIEVRWNGVAKSKFSLNYITVTELNSAPEWVATKRISKIDPTSVQPVLEEQQMNQIIFGQKTETYVLQVGSFVYMDTLVLDNVMNCDIDDQFELSASQATVTITNPKGYYSPDYNSYLFPELGKVSPWSYYINGMHVGVLSDNTPVRIFMGYGQSLERVFTGLIDKVDLNGTSTLNFTCRNMYKRLLEKVITERKQYPELGNYEPDSEESSTAGMDYRAQILIAAKTNAAKLSVDPLFILAMARHETGLGTTGLGVPEKGGYILGYGCPSKTAPNPIYAGVDRQTYYGAKRVSEALASKNRIVASKADVYYFHDGGDKGTSYTWSQDRENWVTDVWNMYSAMKLDPNPWDIISTNNPTSDPVAGSPRPWLKSAVVEDLVGYAGLFGWRANNQDIHYPDAVIEETYLIEIDQAKGKMVRAVPNRAGVFETVDTDSIPTPQGWLNPFVDNVGRTFKAYGYKVSDAINEVMVDTGYRTYCDRYGTFRLEKINMQKPIVDTFTEYENLISITKTIDWSRGRSHVVVIDELNKRDNFLDGEILTELKGEVRTAVASVPWAKTYEQKKQVADRLFFDMKRSCRTLQVSVPMNPSLEILDRVNIINQQTTTRSVYTIKGIRTSFSENGAVQVIDLMWSKDGVTI